MPKENFYEFLSDNAGVLISALVLPIIFFVINRTTRSGIVARGTFREIVRQPVFLLVVCGAALLTLLNLFVPFFAFKDETKMFIDVTLSTILVAGLLLGVWSAATSISEEVEGRTAMTLLSKPILRWQFILGKYLGIAQANFAALLLMTAVALPATYFKYGYDKKETGGGRVDLVEMVQVGNVAVPWVQEDRFETAVQIIPGLALVYLQVAVMSAVAVTLSTRLPMLVNLVTCFAIYVVGHLMPQLTASRQEGAEFVQFIAKVFASVLPALDAYDTSAAVATGTTIKWEYIQVAGLYSICYIAIAMLLAFILFEDHDLA